MKQILKYIYEFKINTYWGIPDKFDERYYHLLLADIQKWFRDKHGIHIQIVYRTYEVSMANGYYFYIGKKDIYSYAWGIYKSYEKALEAGILKAFQKLSLIELTNMEDNEYI